MTYNAAEQIDKLTTPSGVITYSYDPSYRLTTVIYPTSPTTSKTYQYTQTNPTYPYALTANIDENNHIASTWTYDVWGRATSSQRAGTTQLTTVTYNNATGTVTATNPLNLNTTYNFTTAQNVSKQSSADRAASGSVAAATMTYAYDSNGFVASMTDWNGNETVYENDSHGLPTHTVEASGSGVARTTTTTWCIDSPTACGGSTYTFHLPAEIDTAVNKTTLTYDASGNMLGRTIIDETGTGQRRTTTYSYDGTGHRLTATDPLGHVTSYIYSGDNLSTVTDPLGHVTTYGSYNGFGEPQAITDPNGVVTSLSYDGRGRLLTRTVAVGTSAAATTTFGYDAVGNLTTLTLADNTYLTYTYDSANRRIEVADSAGDTISYTLDAMGDITKENRADPSGTLQKTMTQAFDALARLQAVTGAAGQTTTYGYDSQNNLTAIVDARSTVTTPIYTTITYDELNRKVNVEDPLGNETDWTYDVLNNVTSVEDPRGLFTTYTRDGFGNVLVENSPDRGTITKTYDAAGNVLTKIDARSPVTNASFTYDALNRELTEVFPSYTTENITYMYDDTTSGHYGIGRRHGFTDESGVTTYTYDPRGNLATMVQTIEASGYVNTYTTAYAYNLADRVMHIATPYSTTQGPLGVVSYVYDSAGRIGTITSNITGTNTTLASGIQYKPFGPVFVINFGNGLTGTYTYDHDYRETAINTAGSSLTVQNQTLSYNSDNNVSVINDAIETGIQTFTYDYDHRLTYANNGAATTYTYGAQAFSYDANGNRATRISGHTATYSYQTGSNMLTQTFDSGATPAYDTFTWSGTGGILTDSRLGGSTAVSFTYGGRDLLHSFYMGGSQSSAMLFTAQGDLAWEWYIGVQTTDYHYDQQHRMIGESNDASGNGSKQYIWLYDLPIADIEDSAHPTIHWAHADQLGTPRKLTNATPTIVWDRVTEPFGEIYYTGYNPNVGTVTYNFGFPGQYYDSKSYLFYNGARYYYENLGIYFHSDPAGVTVTTPPVRSLFPYANQNPINNSDPSGLCPDGTNSEQDELNKELEHMDEAARLAWLLPPEEQIEEGNGIQIPPAIIPNTDSSTPTGMSGSPLIVAPGTNSPDTIGDVDYSGHALDQMQGRGIFPSMVSNTLTTGFFGVGNTPGTLTFYDPGNNMMVVTNKNGKVITVRQGAP